MIALMTDAHAVDDLESLFRAHQARLVRALTLVCGDAQAADDAVQHAFIKAHLRWGSIMNYDDPVGWIRRVAINSLRDEHRRVGRKSRIVDRLAAEPTTDWQNPEPDGSAELLASLPRQQRLCLALFYIDGLSIAETAATLDISDGTVKFHLHQGRAALRSTLTQGDKHE